MATRIKYWMLLVTASLVTVPVAHAQFAVIDVASLGQLIQQAATLAQQLATLQSQLQQAQAQYASITGGRGMQNLLAGINRNYLPTDWASLMAAANGAGPLGATVQNATAANAVLTPVQVASLPGVEQGELLADRQNVALLEATVEQALATTSARFATLQQLIGAVGATQDAKASLDLEARIAAEQAMLVNDQSKLQVLYQAAQVQLAIQQQRLRERAIADIGSLRTLPAMGL